MFDQSEARNQLVLMKKQQWQHMFTTDTIDLTYKTLTNVHEHRFDLISNYHEMKRLFQFIEHAVSNHRGCLIVSLKNKCCTVVMAIIYLLFKFNWSAIQSLEYINHKKIDVEITNGIMSRLKCLQEHHEEVLRSKGMLLRKTWNIEKMRTSFLDPSQTCVNIKYLTKWMLDAKFVLMEEEATLINHFMNSWKLKWRNQVP